jgi:hypothetical protein
MGPAQSAFGVSLRDHPLRDLALRIRMIKDHRAVLAADIGTLPIQGCRVMDREEDLKECLEVDPGVVEADLDHLGMAGRARADLLVGRLRAGASGISGHHGLTPLSR